MVLSATEIAFAMADDASIVFVVSFLRKSATTINFVIVPANNFLIVII